MDRNNIYIAAFVEVPRVALRKESVDRNLILLILYYSKVVALRKESVDRNFVQICSKTFKNVALRKESVDRNFQAATLNRYHFSRSPQGERG